MRNEKSGEKVSASQVRSWLAALLLAVFAVLLIVRWHGRAVEVEPPAGLATHQPEAASAAPLHSDEPADAGPPTTPDAAAPKGRAGPVAPAAPLTATTNQADAKASWQGVTMAQVMSDLMFSGLPPDAGVVTPIAATAGEPPEEMWGELDTFHQALQTWPPGRSEDVVERTRNLLFVPAVVDVVQLPMEAYVPPMVYEILERDIDRAALVKILYWIAVNYEEGSDAAVDQMQPLGIRNGPSDLQEIRHRMGIYAVKLIGRLSGVRPGR